MQGRQRWMHGLVRPACVLLGTSSASMSVSQRHFGKSPPASDGPHLGSSPSHADPALAPSSCLQPLTILAPHPPTHTPSPEEPLAVLSLRAA